MAAVFALASAVAYALPSRTLDAGRTQGLAPLLTGSPCTWTPAVTRRCTGRQRPYVDAYLDLAVAIVTISALPHAA